MYAATVKRIALVLVLVGVCVSLLGPSVLADPQSVNVVIIGGTTLDTNVSCGYGTGPEANVMGWTGGGCLPVAGTGLTGFTFTAMHPSAVSAASLASYDTAVLNVASSAMQCNTSNLTLSQQADLVAFVGSGKKLIIHDSECYPGPVNYSWLPYPFTTANPGALGQTGTLNVLEDNTLASGNSADPYYINPIHLGSSTDAVGDMNVMTTYDANWCVGSSGTNAINVTGPVQTYAKYPSGTDHGLIIYNGLDQDYQYYPWADPWLRKMWVQELQQPFNPSNLPCGYTVVGITLVPATDSNPVGDPHMVTATLSDLLGNPQPGIQVTFSVVSGPNTGASGTCSVNADCTTDANGQVSWTYTGSGGVGTDNIQAQFTDTAGNPITSQPVSKDWTNRPPVLTVDDDPVVVDEGDTANNTGTVSDPDGDTVALTASVGTVVNNNDGTWSWFWLTSDGLAESQMVTIYGDDGNGGTAQVQFQLTVNNVPPSIDSITAPTDPVNIGEDQPVSVQVGFSDPAGTADEPYTCDFDFDNDGTDDSTVSVTDGSMSCASNHTYGEAGVYTVKVTVTDKDGGSDTDYYEFIVVYDPSGGFVTGGGWIDSPEGALVRDASLVGKATFGFVSKYQKGATEPTGNTEFQFHAGDLNFHSESYAWLVIANHKALYKGTGTINGVGNYGFLLSAIDEALTPSTDVDMFRIKIWDMDNSDALVYDNQVGCDQADDADPCTAIASGSIVIHKGKK